MWLVFYRKHTKIPSISYENAVEEALCVGWIDSLIKRIEEDRYARKFTPRSNTRKWSKANLKRIEKLKAEGRLSPAGLAVIDPDVTPVSPPSERTNTPPRHFQDALDNNESARKFFESLAPSYRRNIISWIDSAKREQTRKRRLEEAISLLSKKKKLGMK